MGHKPGRSTTFLFNLFTLFIVLIAGFGVVILGGALFGYGLSGDEVSVQTSIDGDRLSELPSGAIAPDDVSVSIRVTDATDEQLRWFAVRDLPYAVVLVAVLWLLRGILKSVRDGTPFTENNVTRLRQLGLILLAGIPAATLMHSFLDQQLAAAVGLSELPFQLHISEVALLGGLGTFVLSEVFAEGVRMRDDLEGTI